MAKTALDSENSQLSKKLPALVVQHHWKTLTQPLQEWKTRKQAPPVLLLTGPSGIGKNGIAHFLAQWILCENHGLVHSPFSENSSSLLPCEKCSSCQKIQSGNGVDLTVIASENEEDSSSTSGLLKVEQFRKLKSTAGFGASEGRHKITLILSADRMTQQAANSVLKLLEETPAGWIFILTATDSSLLLPTLVSRCQVHKLKPFSNAEIQELLKTSGIPQERIKISAELSQGSWSRALHFASDEVWKQRKTILEFLNAPSAGLLSLVDWAAASPVYFDTLVDLLEHLTAELIRWSSLGIPPENYPWIQADGKENLVSHAKEILRKLGSLQNARSFWIKRAERMAQVRQESLAPLNRKLLSQDLLIPWLGAKL